MAIAGCAADAIPLTLHLVGTPAALEAILRNAIKSVTVAINIQSESGYGWGQTYAFDGHEIQCTEILSTDPDTHALDSNFEAEGTLMDIRTAMLPPEPPVDPPEVFE